MNKAKIVLVGDGGVGKTTLLGRMNNYIDKRYLPTIGVDTQEIELFHEEVGSFRMEIFDVAGQEKFHSRAEYYKEADCVLLMMDISSRMSMRNISFWLDDISKELPVLILANKRQSGRNTGKIMQYINEKTGHTIITYDVLTLQEDPRELFISLLDLLSPLKEKMRNRKTFVSHILPLLPMHTMEVKYGGEIALTMASLSWKLRMGNAKEIYENVREKNPYLVSFFGWRNEEQMIEDVDT